MTNQNTLRQDRAIAVTVPCFYCHKPAGQECVNTLTGQPLLHIAAHWARLKTAEQGIPF